MNHAEPNITNDIVPLLIKEDLHTRAIAEKLKSYHSTILHKLQKHSEENRVDFRMEETN